MKPLVFVGAAWLWFAPFGLNASPIAGDSPKFEVGLSVSALDSVLVKAYEALAAKKTTEARQLFEQAIRLDSKAYLPWLGLADVARLTGDATGAETALRKAAELAPGKAEPVIAMARLNYARKNYDEAERLFKQAIAIDPKSPVPWVDLGDMYAGAKHDVDGAIGHYEEAVKRAPEHAGAHYAWGMLLLARNEPLNAISHLNVAQEQSRGRNALPALALGRAYSKIGKWKLAEESFGRALNVQPDLVDAWLGRAAVRAEMRHPDQARSDLQQAEKLEPKRAETPFRIGILEQEAGRFPQAYEAYERALSKDAALVMAYNNVAWMAATRKERLNEALAWIQKARSFAPKDVFLIDTHGWVLRARGDLDGAVKLYQEGLSIKPGADLYYHLGILLMEKGLMSEARDSLRHALQLQPDFPGAKDALVRMKKIEQTLK